MRDLRGTAGYYTACRYGSTTRSHEPRRPIVHRRKTFDPFVGLGTNLRRQPMGIVIGLLIVAGIFAIATLIGAFFLRAAISLYNKLAGGEGTPEGVPEPDMGKAIIITFVATLANAAAGFVVGFLLGGAAAAAGGRGPAVNFNAQLGSLPLSLLVMAAMLTAMLPTTFMRAFLVTLLYLVIGVIVVIVIGGISFMVLR
jgi:hypothetical protein